MDGDGDDGNGMKSASKDDVSRAVAEDIAGGSPAYQMLRDAVRQPAILLPTLFMFAWQATPTAETAFLYFLTNEIGLGPEILGRAAIASSVPSTCARAAVKAATAPEPRKPKANSPTIGVLRARESPLFAPYMRLCKITS